MSEQLDKILQPYFDRIDRRSGLPTWMTAALRYRPQLVQYVRTVLDHLLNLEGLFEYSGTVRMSRDKLYRQLAVASPEWVMLMPHPFPGAAPGRLGVEVTEIPLVLDRESRLALDQATALAKKVGLLQEGPKGVWGLDYYLLKKIRRSVQAGARR